MLKSSRWLFVFVAACSQTAAKPVTSEYPAEPPAVAEKVYAGKMQAGWNDYGWAPRKLNEGPAELKLAQKAGWIIAKPGLQGRYGGVSLRFKADPKWGDFFVVHVGDSSDTEFPRINVTPRYSKVMPDGWTAVFVPMSVLNPDDLEPDRVVIKASKSVPAEAILVDDIAFTVAGPDTVKPSKPVKAATLRVDCKAPRHAISPDIYGIAHGQAEYLWKMRPSGRRWGGNPTSRYNWKINTWNTGNDYFFRNVPLDVSWESFVAKNKEHAVSTALTVPILGWVAKDNEAVGFPVSKLGAQQNVDGYKPDAGNGNGPDGKPLAPLPPTQTSIAAPPEFVAEWVRAIRTMDQRSGKRSVQQYILDNEPMLWNSTHRDVHPEPLGYDELLDRLIRYGTVVRKEDPQAVIAGPAEWGWPAYQWSAIDAARGFTLKPDRRAHGDVPLVEWYLQKLAEHEKKTGVKILDVLDLHYYPQGDGIGIGTRGGVDRNTAYKRLRSTRSLWDPSYTDESWVKEPVRLLPRMKAWIDKNYPGLGISIGEWNFGAENHVSGGLATAEALGRFAEAGITSAYYWDQPPEGSQAYWAFVAYRNYDGVGGRFLDQYVASQPSEGTSAFASIDETGKKLVIIWLNLQHDQPLMGDVDVSSCGTVTSSRVFANRGGKEGLQPATLEAGKTLLTPWSVQVVELKLN